MDNKRFSEIDIEQLARECKIQTQRYFQTLASEARYCFELLIRAFRDENESALTHTYKIYQPILEGRARKHPAYAATCRDANLLACNALSRFYFAVRQDKFSEKFQELSQALAYLYACLHTAILTDVRGNITMTTLDSDQYVAPEHPTSDTSQLMKMIDDLLPSDEDRLLVRLRYVYEMKPAKIAEEHAQIWDSPRAVSVSLQRIRRHLSASPTLRMLLNPRADHAD